MTTLSLFATDSKFRLKKCKDGLTVNNDVITNINPLMVINGKMGEYQNVKQPDDTRQQTNHHTFMATRHLLRRQ
jgi:hypothetical protein